MKLAQRFAIQGRHVPPMKARTKQTRSFSCLSEASLKKVLFCAGRNGIVGEVFDTFCRYKK